MNQFCIYCGTEISSEARFCHSCGKPISAPAAQECYEPQVTRCAQTRCESASVETAPTNKSKFNICSIIKNSILLTISILLFAMSFLPIFSIETDLTEDVSISTEISAIDGIVFLFDSFYKWDDDDITDSYFFDRMEDLSAEIADEYSDLEEDDEPSSRFEKSWSKMCYLLTRIALRSADYETSYSDVMIAVASFIYIIFTLSLLTFAVFSFIGAFGVLKCKSDRFYKLSLGFLSAIPALALFVYSVFIFYAKDFGSLIYSLIHSLINGYPFPSDFSTGSIPAIDYSMGTGAILMLVFSITALVGAAVFAFITRSHETKFNIPLRALTLVFTFAIIILTLSPIVTTSVKCKFSGKSSKSTVDIDVYPNVYTLYDISEEGRDEWSDQFEDMTLEQKREFIKQSFDFFEYYTKKDVAEGRADATNRSLLVNITGMYFHTGPLQIVSYIPLIYLALIALVSFIMTETFLRFATGIHLKKALFIIRIIAMIFSILAVAAAIAYTVHARIFFDRYGPSGYELSMSIGIIFAMILSIANLAFPDKRKSIPQIPVQTTTEII